MLWSRFVPAFRRACSGIACGLSHCTAYRGQVLCASRARVGVYVAKNTSAAARTTRQFPVHTNMSQQRFKRVGVRARAHTHTTHTQYSHCHTISGKVYKCARERVCASVRVCVFWIDDRLYSATLRSLEQTHCARMWCYISD